MQFLYLAVIHEGADLMVDIDRRVGFTRACYILFGQELYGMTAAPLLREGPLAEGRGDSDSAVRVRDADPRLETLYRRPSAPLNPRASYWIPATDQSHQPLVCQALKQKKVREHQTTVWKQQLFFWVRVRVTT